MALSVQDSEDCPSKNHKRLRGVKSGLRSREDWKWSLGQCILVLSVLVEPHRFCDHASIHQYRDSKIRVHACRKPFSKNSLIADRRLNAHTSYLASILWCKGGVTDPKVTGRGQGRASDVNLSNHNFSQPTFVAVTV